MPARIVRTVQHRPDRFNPEVTPIAPMQARYVIRPDDIIAYADINVDYRSEPELSEVLLVLQRLQTPPHKGGRR